MRFGGDEFVCGLPDVTVTEAKKRFSLVNADLAAQQASISAGLAQMHDNDDLQVLIARADKAMYAERRTLRAARPRLQYQRPGSTGASV